MSFRKERKYKLTIYEFNILKDLLVKKGMKKLYEPRKINSLYYDNELNEMFHHSEEGVLPRKKIRIRWYNTNFKSNLETRNQDFRYFPQYEYKNNVNLQIR